VSIDVAKAFQGGRAAVCTVVISVCLLAATLMGPAAAMTPGASPNPQATATNPELGNYTNWNFEEQGAIRLVSGWRVFRNKLLAPEQLRGFDCKGAATGYASERVSLPDVWGPALTSTVSSGHGVATYCIELNLPQSERFLALRFGTLRTISRITAVYQGDDAHLDVIPLYQNGDPLRAPNVESLNPAVPVISLPYRGERVRIIVQLANYVHKQGGLIDVPTLDYYSRLDAQQRRDASLPMALVLVLLMVSIGTVIIGRMSGNQMRYNVFAFLTAASAFRVFSVSDIIWDYWPSFPLSRKYDFEYLSLFLVLPAYYMFVVMLLGRDRNWFFSKIVYSVSGLFACFAVFAAPFFAPGTVTLLREPFQVFWIINGFVIAFIIIRAVVLGRGEKLDAVIVLFAAVVMAGYELLSVFGLVPFSMEWSQLLVLLVTMLHARAFVVSFRGVEAERDQLTESLLEANTALEGQATDLRLALRRAEESSRAKNEFLATMSHELRTPLNAIIGFSEVMEKEAFGPLENKHYKDYVKDIYGSGRHLLSIVNDILDLARIESGNDELYEDEFDPVLVVEAMLRIVGPQAALKNITCNLECASDLPMLHADQRKFKQILINLLNNAIKFNFDGGRVTVSIDMVDNGLKIEVKDTGIGMNKDDIPRALARFQQVDSELARRYEGLGIGLSLVDALSEQHGATLEIESEMGLGTSVSVTFPEKRLLFPAQKAAI